MRNIKLRNGITVDLWLNVSALSRISTKISIADLSSFYGEEKTFSEKAELTAFLIECLANGAIQAKNMNISIGIADGKMRNLFPENYFSENCTMPEIISFVGTVIEVISEGIAFDVPENVKLPPVDLDLLEIEHEKKNSKE